MNRRLFVTRGNLLAFHLFSLGFNFLLRCRTGRSRAGAIHGLAAPTRCNRREVMLFFEEGETSGTRSSPILRRLPLLKLATSAKSAGLGLSIGGRRRDGHRRIEKLVACNAIALARSESQLGASVELLVAQLSRASSHSQMSQSTFRTSIHAIRQLCTSCDAYERAIHSRSKKIGTLHS
jgi:hypothetical protein